MNAHLAAEPALKKHEKRLRDVRRLGAHQLTPEAEAALAAFGVELLRRQTAREFPPAPGETQPPASGVASG